MSPARHEEDKDPVISEYDIFITPSPDEDVYLLQYPIRNRELPYTRHAGAVPQEMRIKPKSGFVEVDVEMDPMKHFAKHLGLEWGAAMRKAKASGLTTFGAAAGFGPGPISLKPEERRQHGDAYALPDVEHYGESLFNNEVFRKQTMTGQLQKMQEGKPQYMLGAFRGSKSMEELHLTRVTGVAQLRPAFHHVDAAAHVDKASTAREVDEGKTAQPRGFTQSYKSQREDAPPEFSEKNLMQIANEEKWIRMNYFDEEDAESYQTYEKLFVKETAAADKLYSSMSNEEYLDAISAPRYDPSGRRKKKPLTRKQREAIEIGDDDADRPGAEEPPEA